MNERGFRILNMLDEVAKGYNTTPAGISIAWLLSRPCMAAPIASATNTRQLQELIDATEIYLDEQAIKLLNGASKY